MPSVSSKPTLTGTSYGKSRIRLVQVTRRGDRHDLRDLTVAVAFEGDYDTSYTDGDNRDVLPTDTMKNTVYALAAREGAGEPEAFGMILGRHFISRNPKLARVNVDLIDHGWSHIADGAREHGQAFVRRGPEVRTARVVTDRAGRVGERRHQRPDHHEDVAIGVCRFSARRVHDAAGDPRSPARDRVDRHVDVSRHRCRVRTPSSARCDRRCSTRSRGTTAFRCSTRSMRWAKSSSTRIDLVEQHHARDAEPPSPADRSHQVRHGEPQRDLRGDRGAARLDQGDTHQATLSR